MFERLGVSVAGDCVSGSEVAEFNDGGMVRCISGWAGLNSGDAGCTSPILGASFCGHGGGGGSIGGCEATPGFIVEGLAELYDDEGS